MYPLDCFILTAGCSSTNVRCLGRREMISCYWQRFSSSYRSIRPRPSSPRFSWVDRRIYELDDGCIEQSVDSHERHCPDEKRRIREQHRDDFGNAIPFQKRPADAKNTQHQILRTSSDLFATRTKAGPHHTKFPIDEQQLLEASQLR